VLASTILCLIDNSGVILFGRFLYGMAAGAFTVYVPKYVSEITPKEYRGPFGAVCQFMCTAGIFFVALLGIPIPNNPEENLPLDSFEVQQYWRVIWGLPAVFVVLQVALMTSLFKYDVPMSYKRKGEYSTLREFYE
jgi:MFS family permease